MKKKSLMEDKRNNKVQRPHICRNPNLLLWHKMVAVRCFVWALGLQLQYVQVASEMKFQVLAILKKIQYAS